MSAAKPVLRVGQGARGKLAHGGGAHGVAEPLHRGFAIEADQRTAGEDDVDVGYADPIRLMADLRGMAAANLLASQAPPRLTRGRLASVAQSFATHADPDGRLRERFELVFMTGWAPGPDQPQPARRGSATASLAAALKPKSE